MSANTASEIPVTREQLAHYLKQATNLLKSVQWDPRRSVAELQSELEVKSPQKPIGWKPASRDSSRNETISILDVARPIGGGDELMNEHVNQTLNVMRTGLCIALHVASLYAKVSGLETLRERNSKNQLTTQMEQVEFRDKSETHAAITAFVLSYFIVWKLQQSSQEADISESALSFRGLPEMISLSGQLSAMQCTLFHLGSYLKSGGVLTGVDFRKMTELYFAAVLEEIKGKSQSLKHTEQYTERNYRLEKTTFSVNGFHGDAFGAHVAVEFKRVDINTIVGNRIAKLYAYRLAQALIAYDFEKKMNPMVELGGFPWIYLMKGIPGTGKTLLIAAILTMVKDYCDALNIPFRPHPFPNAIVSTFQGGSAENMENWMAPLSNSHELLLAPVDDAENSFQDRSMQGVSSGVREIIGVFLRRTEGASAINRGNVIIMFATNIPEQVDKAVLSRVLGRMDVDGARTRADFLDQMRLWTGGYDKYKSNIVNLEWPGDYEYLSGQKFKNTVERTVEALETVRDRKLARIIDEVKSEHNPHEHDFYAALFVKLQQEYPFFSSRDVRNIQVAVGSRLLDFDFPEEWLTKRESFVVHPYDTKKDMIVKLMLEHMGGLKFHELLYEETFKYLNTMVSILDASYNREVEDTVKQMKVRDDATSRYGEVHKRPASKHVGGRE
ncbi:MAG: AAA family ATPase [Parcubacteria group bacterium]|nr:AAA family ATPase [Candidatus Wildermuthbacteria bacterium]MBI2109444.1 AAA family ATPase [Parcubacteria group bacterium]